MSRYSAQVPGQAEGELIVLEKPLSLWGGFNPATGAIIDANHPQIGSSLAGRIVAMPHGRGSSSSSSVLAEAMRLGTAPAGLVLGRPDPILLIGSLVAKHLYGADCPILVGEIPEQSGGRWSIRDDRLDRLDPM